MLDRMTAETPTFCRSQVEVLQGVVIEIAIHKPEDTRGEIAVVARTAADRVRSGVRRCRGQVVGGVIELVYRISLSWNPLRAALKAMFRFLVSLLPRVRAKPRFRPPFQPSRSPGCRLFS